MSYALPTKNNTQKKKSDELTEAKHKKKVASIRFHTQIYSQLHQYEALQRMLSLYPLLSTRSDGRRQLSAHRYWIL